MLPMKRFILPMAAVTLLTASGWVHFKTFSRNSLLEKRILLLQSHFKHIKKSSAKFRGQERAIKLEKQKIEEVSNTGARRLLEENQRITQELSSLQSRFKELLDRNQYLNDSAAGARQDLDEKDKIIKAKDKTIETRGKTIEGLGAKIKALKDEIQSLALKRIQDRTELEKKLAYANSSVQRDEMVKKLTSENQGLKSASDAATQHLDATRLEMDNQKKKLIMNQALINELKQMSLRTLDQKSKLEQSLKQLENEKKLVSQKLEETIQRSKKLTDKDSEIVKTSLEAANVKLQKLVRENAIAHYNLGVMFMRQNDFKMAAEEFENALSLNPNDAMAHYNLAVLYDAYLQKPSDAIPQYEAYIRLLPKASDAKEVEYRLMKVRLNEETGIGRDLRRNKA